MSADGFGGPQQPQVRIPPQSTEAEQAVLGALMMGLKPERAKAAWDEASALLTEDSFYRRDHQMIWRALAHLAGKSRPMDSVTVGEFFERQGMADLVDGGAYLVELASTTPSAAHLKGYAEIVADKALLRNLIQVGTGLVDAGFNPDGRDSIEIIGQAQTDVASLLQAQPSEVSAMSSALDAAFEELTERHASGAGMDGLPTGYPEYDDILGGLVPGLHLLAGRPKHGKSTLAQNIAEHVALRLGKPVHIVILEMSEKQYAKRVIASVGSVDSQKMRRGTLDQEDWGRVSNAVRKMRGAPMFISKPGSTRIEHICAQIRRQHAKTPLGLAVLDYLQLVEIVTGKGENYSVAVGRVTRCLVNLSQELQIPIVLLSQLNRDLEKRENKRPTPADLRDSGSIEADAETVTFVYRDEMYNKNSPDAGTAEVIVALNRNGPDGMCRLLFNGANYRCDNLPLDWEPKATAPKEPKTAKRFGSGSKERAPRADIDA
jgi:replicative DNA helicase